MRNKDVIYASNAESVEVLKFIGYANSVTTGVATTAVDAGLSRHAFYTGRRQGAKFLRANEG